MPRWCRAAQWSGWSRRAPVRPWSTEHMACESVDRERVAVVPLGQCYKLTRWMVITLLAYPFGNMVSSMTGINTSGLCTGRCTLSVPAG